MFIPIITPNQTRSMPSRAAAGASSGMMMKAISKKSRKKPSTKIARLATISRPMRPPGSVVSRCSIQRSPFSPRKTSAKAVEPTRMNITMAVREVVYSLASRSTFHDSRLLAAARPIAPTAPTAPASVGVAIPAKMLPSTSRISTRGGISTVSTWRASFHPAASRTSGGSAGADAGLTLATSPT